MHSISIIRNLITFNATAQLIHDLINTRLDFCNSILYNLSNNKIERLQRIQNQAARMLKCIPHMTILFFKFYFCHKKAVNNTAPEYLSDLIRFNDKVTTVPTRASFKPYAFTQ